jgi:hypothetical protein
MQRTDPVLILGRFDPWPLNTHAVKFATELSQHLHSIVETTAPSLVCRAGGGGGLGVINQPRPAPALYQSLSLWAVCVELGTH